jgi:hypothetical protein
MFRTVNSASVGTFVRRGQAAWHAKILQVRPARCVSRRPARLPAPNPLAISALGRRSPSGRLLCLSADRRRDNMVEVPDHVTFSRLGRIAQLVEQLTLNQRVQGSNPCAPTIDLTTFFPILQQNKLEQLGLVGRSVGSFCSPFELANGTFGERRIAVEVVRVKD